VCQRATHRWQGREEAARIGRRLSSGGSARSPLRGSTPATVSRREGAPRTRLDVAQLRAVVASPIDASLRRIERVPTAERERPDFVVAALRSCLVSWER
jgi:hypothetical protein